MTYLCTEDLRSVSVGWYRDLLPSPCIDEPTTAREDLSSHDSGDDTSGSALLPPVAARSSLQGYTKLPTVAGPNDCELTARDSSVTMAPISEMEGSVTGTAPTPSRVVDAYSDMRRLSDASSSSGVSSHDPPSPMGSPLLTHARRDTRKQPSQGQLC